MNFKLACSFALRELRGGIKGFKVLIACIALGVSAISGVNAVALSITGGLAEEGNVILGADASFTTVQRRLNEEERQFLKTAGKINEAATMRAMARTQDVEVKRNLVELKAVGEAWPHIGDFDTEPENAGAKMSKGEGIVVAELLLERMKVKVGDSLAIGKGEYEILGVLVNEPDRGSENFSIAPRVLMSLDGLEKSGLNQQGAIIYWTMRVDLNEKSDEALETFLELAKSTFPQAGWRVRSRHNASPTLKRNVDRFSRFLTLVGLATLIVGGVGIANAVRAFLEAKRPVIATMKSLGASGRFIFILYLIQILCLASMGIAIGLLVGVSMPILAEIFLRGLVPFNAPDVFTIPFFAVAIAFGMLTAIAFALWPLGQTRDIAAKHLFAGRIGKRRMPALHYIIATATALGLLATLAIQQSPSQFVATVFLTGLAGGFVVLYCIAQLVQWTARQMPRNRFVPLRLAVSNLHRPGALTNDVVLSLGLGLALLVALTLIDSNLRRQLTDELPRNAPQFFFLDIQTDELEDFKQNLEDITQEAEVRTVPMLRGRIISINDVFAEDYETDEGGEWILSEDRGLTYATEIPEGSTIAEGEWWDADYNGPPLISFAYEEAQELGVTIGDTIEVNVLGRNMKATIANLRHIEWESLSINFVMIFSPNAFVGAPHTHLATLRPLQENQLLPTQNILNKTSERFPTVTIVRVDDTIELITNLVQQFTNAIRICALLALLASCLVLAGSLAAGTSGRIHDAVILKTLGARRITVIGAFIMEYTILGLVGAVFAIICGGITAWYMVTVILEGEFILDTSIVLITTLIALICTIGFGLVETWRVLGYKASGVLREL